MQNEIQKLTESIGTVIVGKEPVIRCVVAGLLCSGHILIEDVPGVGKTQLAAALSEYIKLFDRMMKAYVSGRLTAHEVEAAYYSQMLNSPVHI